MIKEKLLGDEVIVTMELENLNQKLGLLGKEQN
jgi:hypothetical protein